jgi:glycine/D-amino acid oxidase-like deaminating enzyme
MTDPKNEKVVIIGGDISGLSVARTLMIEGYRDILILIREKRYRGDPGHPPSGLIRHFHPDAPFRDTLNDGVSLLRDYREENDGLFDFGTSLLLDHIDQREHLETHPDGNFTWNDTKQDAVPDALRPKNGSNPFWFDCQGDGVGNERDLEHHMLEVLRESKQITVRNQSEVWDGHYERGRWVLYVSGSERIEANVIINASGIRANEIGERLGLTKRKYAIIRRNLFYSTQSLIPEQYLFFLDRMHGNTFRSVNGGTIVSACEKQPVKLEDARPQPVSVSFLKNNTEPFYPELPQINVQRAWSSRFARTSNRTPIIRRDPDRHSVIWVTGMNEFNLTLSFWIGQRVHQLLTEDAPSVTA